MVFSLPHAYSYGFRDCRMHAVVGNGWPLLSVQRTRALIPSRLQTLEGEYEKFDFGYTAVYKGSINFRKWSCAALLSIGWLHRAVEMDYETVCPVSHEHTHACVDLELPRQPHRCIRHLGARANRSRYNVSG